MTVSQSKHKTPYYGLFAPTDSIWPNVYLADPTRVGSGDTSYGQRLTMGSTMAQHRIITEADVLHDLENVRNDIARMDKNIADCVYDMDDCFISYGLQRSQESVCNMRLKILRNGGVWQFVGYSDLNGNFLTAVSFRNKFGGISTCYKNEEKGITIFTSANTEKGLLKKGIKKVDYVAPAWATVKAGTVHGQTYPCIYEATYNRCTGEAEPRKIIGDHVDKE